MSCSDAWNGRFLTYTWALQHGSQVLRETICHNTCYDSHRLSCCPVQQHTGLLMVPAALIMHRRVLAGIDCIPFLECHRIDDAPHEYKSNIGFGKFRA